MAAVRQMQTSLRVHRWLPAATAALLLRRVVCHIMPLCLPAGGAWLSACGTWGGRTLAACCSGAVSRSLQASEGLIAIFTGGLGLTRAIGRPGCAGSLVHVQPSATFLASLLQTAAWAAAPRCSASPMPMLLAPVGPVQQRRLGCGSWWRRQMQWACRQAEDEHMHSRCSDGTSGYRAVSGWSACAHARSTGGLDV